MLNDQSYSNSITLIAIYAIAWAFVFYKHRKQCSGTILSGGFILLTYLLYAVSSYFLYKRESQWYGSMHMFQFVYLFALLYIGLKPVLEYDKAKVTQIKPPPEIVLKTFSTLYVVCTLLYLPSAISNIQEGLSILLLDSSGGADLYNERLDSGRKEDYGVSNVLSIFHNIFSDCAILVYFYYLTKPKGNKFLILVLTMSILSSILISFSTGNRTMVTFIVLSLVASYLLFKNLYNQKVKRIVRGAGLSLAIVVAFLFIVLTVSRFGDMNEGGFESMLSYIGQANLNFNKYAFDLGGIRYGDRTINLFKKFVGFDVPSGIFDTRLKYSNMATNDSIFTTYIGDFVLDFGPWLTPVLVILFTLFILKITKTNNGIIHFYKLIPIHYVMNVCVRGGMYLFCYPFISNLQILAYIFFYVVCVLLSNKKEAI